MKYTRIQSNYSNFSSLKNFESYNFSRAGVVSRDSLAGSISKYAQIGLA